MKKLLKNHRFVMIINFEQFIKNNEKGKYEDLKDIQKNPKLDLLSEQQKVSKSSKNIKILRSEEYPEKSVKIRKPDKFWARKLAYNICNFGTS